MINSRISSLLTSEIKDLSTNARNNLDHDYIKESTKSNFNQDRIMLSGLCNNKPIDFKEGVQLFVDGFVSQVKESITSMISNPIKTIATGALTTLGLSLLPFAGISTVTAAAILTVGVAGFSSINILKNGFKAIKNNKDKKFSEARENIKQMGKSSVDLAVTLPFVPKAVKSVKEFCKYGVRFNSSFAKNFVKQKGIKNKCRVINDANKEITRSYNYRSAVDKQLASENLSRLDKSTIRRELFELDVPDDELASVVVKKIAKAKGYDVAPEVVRRATAESVNASFSPNACEITIKDKSLPDLPRPNSGTHQYDVVNKTRIGDMYRFEMRNRATGEIIFEDLKISLSDDFNKLGAQLCDYSENCQTISALVHEFEHFDQYSKIVRNKGIDYFPRATEAAKNVYRSAINKKGVIPDGTALAIEVEKYMHPVPNNIVSYIKDILEIGARNAEVRLSKMPKFKRLDAIYKSLKPVSVQSMSKTITQGVIACEVAKD